MGGKGNPRAWKIGGRVGKSGVLSCWEANESPARDRSLWLCVGLGWKLGYGVQLLTAPLFSEQCDFTEDQTAGR